MTSDTLRFAIGYRITGPFFLVGVTMLARMISDNNGAPGAIPTRDLPLRRRTLYATELREHVRSKG